MKNRTTWTALAVVTTLVASSVATLATPATAATPNTIKRDSAHFVTGKLSNKPVKNSTDALAVLDETKELFDLEAPADELSLLSHSRDELGQMFKYQQVYKGVPVFGQELILHTDAQGIATSLNGHFNAKLKLQGVNVKPKLSAAEALTAAKSAAGVANVTSFAIADAALTLYEAPTGHQLTYAVTLSTLGGATPIYGTYFIDAENGTLLHHIEKLAHAAAVGSGTGYNGTTRSLNTDSYASGFYLRDTTKFMNATGGKIETYTANNGTVLPGTLLSDADNAWNDPAAVDAHAFSGQVYDYFYTKLGRNSFDNAGATLRSTVHYSSKYNNAFWDGTQMVYGDGDGVKFAPFSASLDVVAHEITHAVTERTAGLIYSGQSGALNESWSDVFGNLIDNKPDNLWLVGEDIYTPTTAGDALRSMSNPTQYNQPDHMSNYVVTVEDNGGVHINSGIPNKAFYNFVTTAGVTRDDAAKIWYRALTQYMTANTQFIDAKSATVQAAKDLYGATSAMATAVNNAWLAVGVGVPNTGDAFEPNDTRLEAYAINPDVAYNGRINTSTDNDWFKLTTNGQGPVIVSLTTLPAELDLYLYDSAGNQVARSWNAGTADESLYYMTSAPGTYYARVYSSTGKYNTTATYTLKANFPSAAKPGFWYFDTVRMETPHPYTNNYNNGTQHTYTRPGASMVGLHYTTFSVEYNYDFVYIKDKSGTTQQTLTGSKSDFWVFVAGDTITSNLVTDRSYTSNGYIIDKQVYFQ